MSSGHRGRHAVTRHAILTMHAAETQRKLAVESSPLLTVYLHNAHRDPGAARATHLLPLKNNPSSNRPCPTCCTSRAAPVVSACQLLVCFGRRRSLAAHDNGGARAVARPGMRIWVAYLWQVDVGHDNGVDGAGGVLGLGGPVAARVVLVLARSTGLPGVTGVGNLLLGGGGGR